MMKNAVISWFGEDFEALDPMLRELHRHGGELSGSVNLKFGDGIAGFIGRRVAKKLGLPLIAGMKNLVVKISHQDDKLYWARSFDHQQNMVSVFSPHGQYPTGYWIESSGRLALVLGVKVIDGGWYWEQRKLMIFGVSVPLWLFPRTTAYKRINDGCYEFSVEVSLPVAGMIVSYNGLLQAVVAPASEGA